MERSGIPVSAASIARPGHPIRLERISIPVLLLQSDWPAVSVEKPPP